MEINMAIDKVREYFKTYQMDDHILEFDVSSATVELAAEALQCEGCSAPRHKWCRCQGLGADDICHGFGDVCRLVDIGRAVACADANGRFAGGVGRSDHTGAAGGQNQTHRRALHQFVYSLHGGSLQATHCAPGAAGPFCGPGHNLHGPLGAFGCRRVGGKYNGAASLQGDHGLITHG